MNQKYPYALLSYDNGVTVLEIYEKRPASGWGGYILEDVRVIIKDNILIFKASRIDFKCTQNDYTVVNDETKEKYNLDRYKQTERKKWFGLFGEKILVVNHGQYGSLELNERVPIEIHTNVFRIEYENYEKDFGTKWNEQMDRLGAERGTVEDMLSI